MEFALQMYVIGYLKGELTTAILIKSQRWDDIDYDDLDLTKVYNRIREHVQTRDDVFREVIASKE